MNAGLVWVNGRTAQVGSFELIRVAESGVAAYAYFVRNHETGAWHGRFESEAAGLEEIDRLSAAPPAVFHITRVLSRGSRRIMGRPGVRVTWCGAPVSSMDCLPAAAREIVATGFQKPGWVRCDVCFGRLLDADFRAAGKVED